MNLEIFVERNGKRLATASGDGIVHLCYEHAYEAEDTLVFHAAQAGYFWVQLEDSLSPVLAYFTGGNFRFTVPFGEKRMSYSPKCFTGTCHLLFARAAMPAELSGRRNLAFNPLDHHENRTLYPHAMANVETRDEAWFAARNAIDGNTASSGHGAYPYGSWGINRREDAALTISFGRPVRADELVITLRADFPHDNWWKSAVFDFSDGSSETLEFEKRGTPQHFSIAPRIIESLTMHGMCKDETNSSPFPALSQLELWGCEV